MEGAPVTSENTSKSGPIQTAGAQPSAAVEQRLIDQLVDRAQAEGLQLTGEGGLLQQLTKRLLESALEGEMTDHLGYDKHDAASRNGQNSRNGTRSKTVLTDVGPVEISVPRDREGSFEPKMVKKRQKRLTGVDEMVISLAAKGLTTGEVQAHLAEVYGAEVSRQTISTITDKVMDGMAEWQNWPLDPGRFLLMIANQQVIGPVSHPLMASAGVLSPRTRRGRRLSWRATAWRSRAVWTDRSLPLEKYCRSSPLVFSFVPRCQGECGSQK
ncbi:transposase [Streptomyces sp. SBT349]|uniref:transposase n=1 Tax=Streptomyces sp. SBT349 TaxID=1580539 RepID=UPI000AA64FE4